MLECNNFLYQFVNVLWKNYLYNFIEKKSNILLRPGFYVNFPGLIMEEKLGVWQYMGGHGSTTSTNIYQSKLSCFGFSKTTFAESKVMCEIQYKGLNIMTPLSLFN